MQTAAGQSSTMQPENMCALGLLEKLAPREMRAGLAMAQNPCGLGVRDMCSQSALVAGSTQRVALACKTPLTSVVLAGGGSGRSRLTPWKILALQRPRRGGFWKTSFSWCSWRAACGVS